MKRLFALFLALFLCVATLSSCTVKFSGTATTGAPITEATDPVSDVRETTAEESGSPEDTTTPETEPSPTETGDGFSKNY